MCEGGEISAITGESGALVRVCALEPNVGLRSGAPSGGKVIARLNSESMGSSLSLRVSLDSEVLCGGSFPVEKR